jgi:oligoendopeptidase F
MVAAVLRQLAAAGNARATLHRYQDAAEEAYAFRFLTKGDVTSLLQQVAASSDLYRDIQREKTAEVGRRLGIADVRYWDVTAPVFGDAAIFSIEEARSTIVAAVAPLGAEYQREMAALLDPANGRFDVSNESGRRSGGFSLGYASFPSVFFAGQYRGSFNDVRVMTHEAGHAVHRELMRRSSILPDYSRGPNFLFESIAALNEMLLTDHLYAHASSANEQRFYLQQFLDGKATAAFYAAPEAELEQAVYEQAQSGILTADRLDDMTQEVYAKYSMWPARVPQLRRTWQVIPLMYEDPFYNVNYVYAGVLALKYYDLLKKDPNGFPLRFMEMLKNGFDAPPNQLLKHFLSIDLVDGSLVPDAMAILRQRFEVLTASN